jgi:hypothetical protein
VLLFHFTFCMHFWLVKILSPNMIAYFQAYRCFYLNTHRLLKNYNAQNTGAEIIKIELGQDHIFHHI